MCDTTSPVSITMPGMCLEAQRQTGRIATYMHDRIGLTIRVHLHVEIKKKLPKASPDTRGSWE